jgi:hypothetical protein
MAELPMNKPNRHRPDSQFASASSSCESSIYAKARVEMADFFEKLRSPEHLLRRVAVQTVGTRIPALNDALSMDLQIIASSEEFTRAADWAIARSCAIRGAGWRAIWKVSLLGTAYPATARSGPLHLGLLKLMIAS